MVGGDWRLAVGGLRLAVGGGWWWWWRLVVGDWWLVAVGSGWQLAVAGWRLEVLWATLLAPLLNLEQLNKLNKRPL